MRVRSLWVLLLVTVLASPAWAQSQAINGTIEGVARDSSGGVLPGVTVTVTHGGTGAQRVAVTDGAGVYRAALLPVGGYRVKAELAGFKTVERAGVTVNAGLTAVVNFDMSVGGVSEVVQVTADSAVASPAKIDLGRTIDTVEIQNLPNVARNPYNFALLQPNVTGYDNEEFGATRINANGSQMRTNYQIDGSSATQKDRAGLRMFQPSETMVEEVKVTTSGFAPEFGQTTGMVYNTITPSGTNQFKGYGSYRFRRKSFSARPFTLATTAPKPDTKVDNFLGAIGGPIVHDRTFFYAGYERHVRDLSADRVITVTKDQARELGLSADALGDGVVPAIQTVNMFIAKVDHAFNAGNRLSVRWSVFNNVTPENIGGGLNTRETSTDFQDRMDSVGVQLVSSLSASRLNEFRFAYGRRNNPRTESAVAGAGPIVQVTRVANFGGADFGSNAREFLEKYWQVVDNFSWVIGGHSLKAGIDAQFIDDVRATALTARYVFPDTASYLAARDGANPFGYTNFQQAIGDPRIAYSQSYYSAFVQDDYRVTPAFKLLYGIRYDLFKVPAGDPNAPYAPTRDFRVAKNNFAPRAGFAWSLDAESRTVVRGSTGIMYEPPLGMFYQDALQENGSSTLLTVIVTPGQTGAPAFPGTLSSLPPGVSPSRSIRAVSPDFSTQWTVLSNAQIERALTPDMSFAAGYVNSQGRDLSLLLNSNVIPTGATLPDGRPIYVRTVLDTSTRVDPSFDTISEIRSAGTSAYNAITLSFNRRLKQGWQAQAFYTWSRAKDDGVVGGRYVIGSSDAAAISDPSDVRRDYSLTSWNVTHTFTASAVVAPEVSGGSLGARLLNDNQLSVILQANSGLPFNVLANRDLNQDGISADRPNNVGRNSGSLGRVFNVDLRYSRFVPVANGMRAEVFFEAKNLFNNYNVSGVNSSVAVDASGNPLAPIPTSLCPVRTSTATCLPVTSTYQIRQMQIGFKYSF
jgi:hypothetical protein